MNVRRRSPLSVRVPGWARDAIWYQIFPERFRNGSPSNDPTPEDTGDVSIPGWKVSSWNCDWYEPEAWEKPMRNFYRSVYLRRYGGDLLGIREKLDYLQELGVNALYLNPVFMAPSLHKYDASCLHHVDPTFGPDREGDLSLIARSGETENPGTWIWTAADRYFIDLVADIHRRGMRIIIDGVFNHVGVRFFAFQDLLKNGRASRYADWFRVSKWNDDGSFEYEGWFGHKSLPELARTDDDLAKPVKDYIFAITRRWMDPDGDGDPGDGVDGWRLDVAFCVPHGFWKQWRKLVKSINSQAFLTAEVVSLASDFLKGDEFDSVMNYMWLFSAVRFFAPGKGRSSAAVFRKELDALRRAYPEAVSHVLQNLLDSHDVGRIATVLDNRLDLKHGWDCYFGMSRVEGNPELSATRPGEDAWRVLRQLTIFQMTYPGAPMLYYGTEVGMWGANDPDNRQPMLWDDVSHKAERFGPRGRRCRKTARGPDTELFSFFRKAIALRSDNIALRRGKVRWLSGTKGRLVGYLREHSRSKVMVLLNASDKSASWNLKRRGRDLWTGGKLLPGKLLVEPRGWRVVAFE